MRSKKVVLDTNTWISFLISKKSNGLFELIRDKQIVLLFSEELIQEFIKVSQRDTFKNYFSANQVSILLKSIEQYSVLITVTSDLNICRDINDNFLINLSMDGKADFLISGDKDLLELEKIEGTKITTLKKLFEIFEKS